jgi:5-methylcytosine-specific restriction endonuclease McrA
MVFVVDTEQRPLAPCHPARARRLLTTGKAAVWRRFPFTIILKRTAPDAQLTPLRVKLDPGSRVTGLALINDATGQVAWAAELRHRGQRICDALLARKALRCGRRYRTTRYRPARFANRRRREGWLPPSLESRLSNVLTWVARLRRYAPVGAVSQELVRFDTQLLQHPAISGVEYQQGELAGYEVREYLLEKWERMCAYCGARNVPLQIEHIVPKACGGSNRVSNLTIACAPCNTAKDTQTAAEFGHPEVQAQARQPLRDVGAVNASRWALFHRLETTGLPIEVGTGGRTKWNRTQQSLPKAHWIDAACVGASTPKRIHMEGIRPLSITAVGHGTRQMCGTDKYGFPVRHRTRQKRHFGFQTGDLVQAAVPLGLKTVGRHTGRVVVRASGSFDLATAAGRVQGVSYRYCQVISRSDGYSYGYIG